MIENRRHPRAQICVPVVVKTKESDVPLSGTATNISIGGVFIETSSVPPAGSEVLICIARRDSPDDDHDHELPGTVRWVCQGGMGVQFGILGAAEMNAVTDLCRIAY